METIYKTFTGLKIALAKIELEFRATYKNEPNFETLFRTFDRVSFLNEIQTAELNLLHKYMSHNKGIKHTAFLVRGASFEDFLGLIQ